MTKLELALHWASQGWAVFPCEPGGKKPLGQRSGEGVTSATTSQQQITDWWTATPDANIAGTGFFVVDIDCKEGQHGFENLTELEATNGVLPETLSFKTPSGGVHLVYDSAGANVSQRKLCDGVDTRAPGAGYVLLPGSDLDAREGQSPGQYSVRTPLRVAPLPVWVSDRCGPRIERDASASVVRSDIVLDTEGSIARVASYLATGAEPAIRGEGANNTAYEVACRCLDFGVSPLKLRELIEEHYQPRCIPPRDPEAIDDTIYHAVKYRTGEIGQQARSEGMLALIDPDAEPIQAPAPSKWRFRGLRETTEIKPPEWLIEGLFPERGIGMIYGMPGTYKSFLLLDMLLHIAAGAPWAGCAVVRPLRVAYVSAEGAISPRLKAWLEDRAGIQVPEENWLFTADMPRLMDEHGEACLPFIQGLAEFNPDLVVFDTLSHAMLGGNENDTSDCAKFMDVVYRMRDGLGTGVWFAHHTNSDGSKVRGNIDIPAKMDTTLVAGAPEDGTITLHMTKQKDAELWGTPKVFDKRKVGDSVVLDHNTGAERQAWADAAAMAARKAEQANSASMYIMWALKVLQDGQEYTTLQLAEAVAHEVDKTRGADEAPSKVGSLSARDGIVGRLLGPCSADPRLAGHVSEGEPGKAKAFKRRL